MEDVKENIQNFRLLIKEKIIWIPMLLTAICSYGFHISHYAIGLDDTALIRYYIDGRAPAMGRYTIYMIEWITKVANFSPFILEIINVLLLSATALICVTLFKAITKDVIPMGIFSIFICIFISFPLFNEIFIYYLHGSPGMSLGYFLTVFATLNVYLYIQNNQKKRIGSLISAVCMMYFAIGIYESFVLVYTMLCASTLFLYLVYGEDRLNTRRILQWLGFFVIPLFLAVILRSVTYYAFAEILKLPNYMRGMGDIKWMFGVERSEHLKSLILDFLSMYGVNVFFYLPIRNYVVSMVAFIVLLVIKIVKKKNGWILLGGLGILMSPWLLMPIEGLVTTYRANLGLAFATAFAFMLVFYEINRKIAWKWMIPLIAGIVIFNQSFDLNHWFYIDHMKYEYQVELASQIYNELEESYDLTKPIVFLSGDEIPETFAKHTHVEYDDEAYKIVENIEKFFGIKLPSRFFDSYGYAYAEVPNLWIYTWGQNAFEEGAVEIAKFFAMHGYEITPATNENWQEATWITEEMPCFPKEGSIAEFEHYIVVKLSD